MTSFEQFCNVFDFNSTTKSEQARGFLWYHCRAAGVEEADLKTVAEYFAEASLPKPNVTRIRDYFTRDRGVHRARRNQFKLTRSARDALDNEYGEIFEPEEEVSVTVRSNVRQTPFLTEAEVDGAFRMAQLYVILHCYENSVRRLIEAVLYKELGADWWDTAANARMKQKVESRKQSEARNKWLSPRGESPLYYLDWGDLVALIRKYEPQFMPRIQDLKFVELRFEELERLRNIVAHHGYLPADEDYERLVISFRDWCLQVAQS